MAKEKASVAEAAGCIAGIVAIVALVLGFLVYEFCFVRIEAGHVGVKSWFGAIEDGTLEAGPHWVHPLKGVKKWDVQVQKDEEPADVPTANGLPIKMKATLLYKLRPDRAADLAREVGDKDYQARVVTPYFKNSVRDVCSEFLPEAFYTAERTKVEARVLERVRTELDRHGFEVESVMLLDPVLPDTVKARIEAKVSAEQDAIRMESIFKQKELEGKANKRVEELKAESKIIEAKGIAEAQSIIKKDLTPEYLHYFWINALEKNHAQTIYVVGADGLPMFLNPAKK